MGLSTISALLDFLDLKNLNMANKLKMTDEAYDYGKMVNFIFGNVEIRIVRIDGSTKYGGFVIKDLF